MATKFLPAWQGFRLGKVVGQMRPLALMGEPNRLTCAENVDLAKEIDCFQGAVLSTEQTNSGIFQVAADVKSKAR